MVGWIPGHLSYSLQCSQRPSMSMCIVLDMPSLGAWRLPRATRQHYDTSSENEILKCYVNSVSKYKLSTPNLKRPCMSTQHKNNTHSVAYSHS